MCGLLASGDSSFEHSSHEPGTVARNSCIRVADHARQLLSGDNAEAIGRISYIPESFVGGPTDMYARYQDAMAAVLHFGSPSLFITMTANPK